MVGQSTNHSITLHLQAILAGRYRWLHLLWLVMTY